MKSWMLAASVLAAAVSATGVAAADLEQGPPPDRYGAYDDPRYSDIYGHPPPPSYAPPPVGPRYGAPPVPPAYVYRHDEEDYGRGPYQAPRRYYSWGDPRGPYGRDCAPREAIKDRLLSQGWRDFRDIEPRGEFATLTARRPSGRLFELTLERCNGEIVSAHPLEERPYGPYAYDPLPRRWNREY